MRDVRGRKYWTYTPGSNARGDWHFSSDWDDGVMGLGQDDLGDLREYGEDVGKLAEAMRKKYKVDGDGSGNARYMIQFRDEVRPGDVVFVKRGRFRFAGVGIVSGGYHFDRCRKSDRQVRPVQWIRRFDRKSPVVFSITTLTLLSDRAKIAALLSAAGLSERELARYGRLCKEGVVDKRAHRCRHASSPAQAEGLMSPRAIAARLKRITRTEHLRETVQREGQRELREYLLHKRGRCAVTGLRVASLLVASHIKDWKECTRDEKLDQANVLLLARNYDAAFDRKLISFDSKGKLVKSDAVSWQELSALGIKKTAKIARPSGSRAKYLRWHLARLIK